MNEQVKEFWSVVKGNAPDSCTGCCAMSKCVGCTRNPYTKRKNLKDCYLSPRTPEQTNVPHAIGSDGPRWYTRIKKTWLCKQCVNEQGTFHPARTLDDPGSTPCDYCTYTINAYPDKFTRKKVQSKPRKLKCDRVDKTGMKPLL